jgi:hypothetical protein
VHPVAHQPSCYDMWMWLNPLGNLSFTKRTLVGRMSERWHQSDEIAFVEGFCIFVGKLFV